MRGGPFWQAGVQRALTTYPDSVVALIGLRENLLLSRLHLVADLRRFDHREDFVDFVHAMYGAGVDIIQLRTEGVSEDRAQKLFEAAVQPAFDHRKLLCVGSDPKLAAAVKADLLHLNDGPGRVRQERGRLHQYSLVGCTVDSIHEADRALTVRADWLSVGPVFPGRTLFGRREGGLDLVREFAEKLPVTDERSVPWFATTGITLDNLGDVLDAGAARVAVSTAIMDAEAPAAAAALFADRLRAHWESLPGAGDHAFRVLGGPQKKATFRAVPPIPGDSGSWATTRDLSL